MPPEPTKTAHERSEELARLAELNSDPGHRLFFLQWAELFRRVAKLGSDPDLGEKREGD